MERKVRYILICVLGDWFIFVWNFVSYLGIFIFIFVCCIKCKVKRCVVGGIFFDESYLCYVRLELRWIVIDINDSNG